MLAAIRLRSGSVYPGIGAHVGYNVIESLRWYDDYLLLAIDLLWPLAMIIVGLVALRLPKTPLPAMASAPSAASSPVI